MLGRMQAAQRQGTVSQELARQTDGVLLAVGGLASILKKKVRLMLHCHACLTAFNCIAYQS